MLTLGKIIYGTISSKEKIELRQLCIRDAEWNAISEFIPKNSHFLDVGCGAGYALHRASSEMSCNAVGIDPNPGEHGVGRYDKSLIDSKVNILKGSAENLTFANNYFDVVYSSHVLEHVENEEKTLKEIDRVLKNDGIVIIGIPTASMAWINWFSQLLFTSHIKIYEFFRFLHLNGRMERFINIFRIYSHSQPRATSILYDFRHYKVKNWEKTISDHFEIQTVIKPFLYPYPNYFQWFKPLKSKWASSSVFFICKKSES
jgi:ubiquinone/menaquinone biosynthesis C-methylase UbiE